MFDKLKKDFALGIEGAKSMWGAAMMHSPGMAKATHQTYMAKAKEQNAFLAIVVMSVMSLVVGSVFLYICLFVNVTVFNAIPTGSLTAADNTTLLGIKTNVNTAFTLGGIIMIVVGAAGIISVLLGMVPGTVRT